MRIAYRILIGKLKETLDVGDMIILKCVLKLGWEVVNWIQRAQDRVEWRNLDNIALNNKCREIL
jgi:hypothetical protein